MSLDKDCPVYHEGDSAKHWFEVVSGVVRTCRYLATGQRQLTGFYYPDEVFGLEDGSYLESAETVTEAVIRRHAKSAPDEVLAKALEKARQDMFVMGHKTAENRVAAFMFSVAEQFEEPGLEFVMSRNDIADHLNLTLHTVSRTICDLARRGLIALNGPQHLGILDADGLRRAAGDGQEESLIARPVVADLPGPKIL